MFGDVIAVNLRILLVDRKLLQTENSPFYFVAVYPLYSYWRGEFKLLEKWELRRRMVRSLCLEGFHLSSRSTQRKQ